tara:strand:+ start:122 stop:508 length:387 start_codon:yes stop_codon:yes gene_type:complete
MKVPNFRPPTAGNFPDLDEQTIAALKVVSDQLGVVTQCLQSNVSPEDNSNSQVKYLNMKSGEAQQIEVKDVKGKPIEVSILDQDKFDFTKLAWEVADQDHINVRVTWDDTENQQDYIGVRLMVRGQYA